MTDHEYAAQLAGTLIDKTEESKLQWRESIENFFTTTTPDGYRVRLSTVYGDEDEGGYADLALQMSDADGSDVFEYEFHERYIDQYGDQMPEAQRLAGEKLLELFQDIRIQIPHPSLLRRQAALESLKSL